jgi:predicted phage-related endonuclease
MERLLGDIKAYKELQKQKKSLNDKMKKLQVKIRQQTLANKVIKVGRYSVYWGTIQSSRINIKNAKNILSESEFKKIISYTKQNKFQIKYK